MLVKCYNYNLFSFTCCIKTSNRLPELWYSAPRSWEVVKCFGVVVQCTIVVVLCTGCVRVEHSVPECAIVCDGIVSTTRYTILQLWYTVLLFRHTVLLHTILPQTIAHSGTLVAQAPVYTILQLCYIAQTIYIVMTQPYQEQNIVMLWILQQVRTQRIHIHSSILHNIQLLCV